MQHHVKRALRAHDGVEVQAEQPQEHHRRIEGGKGQALLPVGLEGVPEVGPDVGVLVPGPVAGHVFEGGLGRAQQHHAGHQAHEQQGELALGEELAHRLQHGLGVRGGGDEVEQDHIVHPQPRPQGDGEEKVDEVELDEVEEVELEGGEEQLVAVFGQHVGGKVRPVGLALEKSLE